MKLKVRKVGNSQGVILPQSVLEQLGSDELVSDVLFNFNASRR